MDMSSVRSTLSSSGTNRSSPIPHLVLPATLDRATRSSPSPTPMTLINSAPEGFFSPTHLDPRRFPHSPWVFSPDGLSPLLSPSSASSASMSPDHKENSPKVLFTFDEASKKDITSRRPIISRNICVDDDDLIVMDDELSAVDIFDPLRPSDSRKSLLAPREQPTSFSPPSIHIEIYPPPKPVTPIPPSLFPYPVKLRLKQRPYPEMKQFSQFLQQIVDTKQSKQTSNEDLFYCQRVQRLTPQHIEHNQSPVTLYIFVENSTEPIRLENVSLQSTVAHILYQLLQLIKFNFDQSLLKLRSRDEYLRQDDVLCDIEYVYNCLTSLRPLQFILVERPTGAAQQKETDPRPSFEQFCLQQHEKVFRTNYSLTNKPLKPLQSMKSLSKSKSVASLERPRALLISDAQWLEEFRKNLHSSLTHIEERFNRLVNPSMVISSIDEHSNQIQGLFNFMKNVQITCSGIQSTPLVEKQNDIKTYINQMTQKFSSEQLVSFTADMTPHLTRLLYELLVILISHIHTYSNAFLIPYEVDIYNDENESLDIQRLNNPPTTAIQKAVAITDTFELLTIVVDTLVTIPSYVKLVRVNVRLCYGNKTIATQTTRAMPIVRNTYQHDHSSHVRFEQQLIFPDTFLCGLQREALLLFEIYACVNDDAESAISSTCIETFDGIPMRLLGWCSQALFTHEHSLITGERYLGVIDGTTTNRTGFYSLRNVLERDCPILTVSLLNQPLVWPEVQARDDMQAKNFTEIDQNEQETLRRLLDRPSLLLVDHRTIGTRDVPTEIRKQSVVPNTSEEEGDFTDDECHFLWSYRYFVVHKPYALPKLLKSRSLWDYPSLIDIYGLVHLIHRDRPIDEIESLELLLPAFPDMHIRSVAYQVLISRFTSSDMILALPQLLQIIKFDYVDLSPIVKHLLQQCAVDSRLVHQLYWYLRQLLLDEHLHFLRYYHFFMSLLYIIPESFRLELQNEYDLCNHLKRLGSDIKASKGNRTPFLHEQLKEINKEIFQSGQRSCRLPCQFSFMTNSIDISACSIFNSFTLPMKLVFNPVDAAGEKYSSIYKIGDDLRQDQIVLQLFSCMDRIWRANDFDFRLSLFNVVQTQERCGFIEMVTESDTLMEIESSQGTIKGTFGESALYDWLRSHNPIEKDFRMAVENLTYSCAGYCVATYILGIGDRHNENVMVKKSGHLFHIDFAKYLGDTQKFGSFNRDRTAFIFTKQMLYAMSDGGKPNDAMPRFVDLCCDAYDTLRQNSSLLLLLLSHLCSSNLSSLNIDAIRFVYDRLSPSLSYAESITRFTDLIVDSLNSTWTVWHGLIHKMARSAPANTPVAPPLSGPTLPSAPSIVSSASDGKIVSAQVVNYEKRTQPVKHYLYKLQVTRNQETYHYRTYSEFYEFYERLKKRFPLIGLHMKFSQRTEDKVLAQRHASDINDFLHHLFRLANEVVESDLLCAFFCTTPQDQQINDIKEKSSEDAPSRSLHESSVNTQSKIRIRLKYDHATLFVMVRHATNLPLRNGNEPKPYCKCYLFPDEGKLTKRKGKPATSRSPIFNDTFTYEMDLADIQKHVLRVSVWNNVLTVGNHALGVTEIVLSQIDWSKKNAHDYDLITS